MKVIVVVPVVSTVTLASAAAPAVAAATVQVIVQIAEQSVLKSKALVRGRNVVTVELDQS